MKLKQITYFFIFLVIQSFSSSNSQDTQDVVQELVDPAIAKNLAASLNQSDLDTNTNYLSYQRNLKKDLFADSSKLTDNQNQIINKLNLNLFTSIIKSFKSAKQFLTELKAKNDQSLIKNITDELTNTINSIAGIISKSVIFQEFDKAGVFKDFDSVKEIKDFLDSLRNQNVESKKVDLSTIEPIVIVAALGFVGVGVLKLYQLNKSEITFTQEEYNALKQSLINGDANKFNDVLHQLINKNESAAKKPFAEVFNKIELDLIKMNIGETFINKVKLLNDIPIQISQNSELFKKIGKLANVDEKTVSSWEKSYAKALQEKNIDGISKVIDNILSEHNLDRTIKPDEIVNLMKENSDLTKVFKEDAIRTQLLKKFQISDLKSKLNLNITQLDLVKTQISTLPKESYVRINDTYYKIGTDSLLHEVYNPPHSVQIEARIIDVPHNLPHPI